MPNTAVCVDVRAPDAHEGVYAALFHVVNHHRPDTRDEQRRAQVGDVDWNSRLTGTREPAENDCQTALQQVVPVVTDRKDGPRVAAYRLRDVGDVPDSGSSVATVQHARKLRPDGVHVGCATPRHGSCVCVQ